MQRRHREDNVTVRDPKLWRRDPRPGLLVIVFGFGAAGFALLLAMVLLYRPFVAFDERMSNAFASVDAPVLDALFRGANAIGDFWTMAALTTITAVVLALRKHRAEGTLLVATVSIGTLMGDVTKGLVERVRPGLETARIPLPDSYSFPSGHALASFLFFGTVAFIAFLHLGQVKAKFLVFAGCTAIAIGVALARVYLGVHWFGDVTASWLLGSAWMMVCFGAYFWAITLSDEPAED